MLRILTSVSITFITLFIIWCVGWLWFATSIALTTTPSTATKAEAIIVLTGGLGRINAGLNLLEQGIAPKLFISGVNEGVKQSDILSQWKNKTLPVPCCFYLGYEAKNTAGNALEVRDWIEKNNIKSFQLITSNYHMPRAFMEVSKAVPDNIEIMRYPILSTDLKPWGRRFWYLTFKEYNKIIFIWLKQSRPE